MAGHGYTTEDRDPARPIYTPSMDSDEDLPRISSLALADRDYRLFIFKKDGRSWVNASYKESSMAEADIKARAKRPRKEKHTVSYQLDKMSPPRRNAIDDLVDDINHNDHHGDDWEILTIDNDNPEITKRQGEVVSFSVILGRINPARRQSFTQERRKSFVTAQPEYNAPKRRDSKLYNRSPPRERVTREQLPAERERERERGLREPSPRKRETREHEANQSYRRSQPVFEDDPFGSTNLFSPDGKPVNAQGAPPYSNAGLPPHIPLDEPIGVKAKNQSKDKDEKENKKSKKWKNDDVIDIDALLNGTTDLLGAEALDHRSDPEFESPIEVEHHPKRGRKQSDSRWGEKWNLTEKPSKRVTSREKSKSRPRRPSLHIPKDYDIHSRPIEVVPATTTRRRPTSYYATSGSHHGSIATASVRSDVSVLEAEYEEYSSSASSGYEQALYRTGYKEADGRYHRATRDHRRGPPSPQQARYGPDPYIRRPRAERYVTDGAIQRYYAPVSSTSARPPLIMHSSAPRFTPAAQLPESVYPSEAGVLIYPSELTQAPATTMRRRDSMQEQEAQLYMREGRDRDREIELLQRERDVYRREAQLHQEIARRASVSQNPRTNRYSYEPRSTRRYTDAYHG